MLSKRSLFGLLLGLTLATTAGAQASSGLRWPGGTDGYFGLNPARTDFKVSCGSVAFPCGVNIPLLEKSVGGSDLRLYGRLGPAVARPVTSVLGAAGADAGGMSYGFGVSWELSPRASATVGWDSHDWRFGGLDREPVRATSLGLQWRY
jgi:hypothetical protein